MKKTLKKTILFICAVLAFSACQKQAETQETSNYKLVVTLENAPFDSLTLRAAAEGKFINFTVKGEKRDKFTWKFTIPDSIVDIASGFNLTVARYDTVSKSARMVFFTENNISLGHLGVEDRENYIHAQYLGQTVFPNEYIFDINFVTLGTLIKENFRLILQDDCSDITVRVQSPYFSGFVRPNFTVDLEKEFYDECLSQYVERAKKYPDSRYFIISLSETVNFYKSNADIRKIYDCLSDKHKNTKWGRNIEYYLFEKFENTSLPTLYWTATEKVVQDSSKYNLLIFTASWCGPCNEEIPILKEIYHDLNEKMIMTYISIDEEETVFAFQKLMRKKEIPWRALLAVEDIRKIRDMYMVAAIPQGVLVYPGGEKMEVIEVRDDAERKRLYSLCGK
ncbi:TlpA family protein disulfide reductase [Candidatus Symbiothrix dinenymphae]|uniref:TlpA family protein disulfide reductase n=1 Tax=Candidatus Symbiothrix dinenymphae TaxID=467085 RepID=UPI0006C68BC0|nr:thioredoxin-like domain-containing protein [Candidatus Symbiothrix dinenymphae]GAP73343.1 thioredoxin family protein [Candidatus Symbiothrix dinenymphae]